MRRYSVQRGDRRMTVNDDEYDLIVIGGAAAAWRAPSARPSTAHGYCWPKAAASAAPVSMSACVPPRRSCGMPETAAAAEDSAGYGFKFGAVTDDWAMVKSGCNAYVHRLNGIYERNLSQLQDRAGARPCPHLRHPQRRDRRLACDRAAHRGRHGRQPVVPQLPGAKLGITSDGFFELEQRPKRGGDRRQRLHRGGDRWLHRRNWQQGDAGGARGERLAAFDAMLGASWVEIARDMGIQIAHTRRPSPSTGSPMARCS